MILAWLVWPFIVLLHLLTRALWQVVRLWYLPPFWGAVAYGVMWVSLKLWIWIFLGADQGPLSPNREQYALLVRVWDRWRYFGFARLLPARWMIDRWTEQYPIFPTHKDVSADLVHVSVAAGVTVAGMVLLLIFFGAMLLTYPRLTRPFTRGAH